MKQTSFILIYLFSVCNCLAADTTGLTSYRNRVLMVYNKIIQFDENVKAAIKAKNPVYIDNARVQLLQYANEGMKELDAIPNFEDDASLKFSCKDVLKFYKQFAEIDIPEIRDFFILEENFLKRKMEFEKKPVKKHSQPEIYEYNSHANKYNKALGRHTQLLIFIEGARKLTLTNWAASEKIFIKSHAGIKNKE